MKKREVQQNRNGKRSAMRRHRETAKTDAATRPSIISHLPDYPNISLSESGYLTFGPMKKYVVPEYFLKEKDAKSDAPQNPKSPSGYTNSELVTAASKGIEHCAPVLKAAIRVLEHIDWDATTEPIEPWEVEGFLTENQIWALAEKLCEYMGSRAASGSKDAVQSLVKLAENCIEHLDKSPGTILEAVAKRRATFPVMFGGLPEHRKSAEDKVTALKLGTETAVRAWNEKSGRPFSLETPVNKLAASLITYIEEVRSRKPRFNDIPLTSIADLPEDLLKQIFALPELEKEPEKWASVSFLLIRDSGFRLAEMLPLLKLGIHRVKNKSSRNCSQESAIKNLEDGIRTALKQAFRTLSRRPKY